MSEAPFSPLPTSFAQETLSLPAITIGPSTKEGDMNTHNSAGDLLEQSATFGAMTEGTAMDWKIIAALCS